MQPANLSHRSGDPARSIRMGGLGVRSLLTALLASAWLVSPAVAQDEKAPTKKTIAPYVVYQIFASGTRKPEAPLKLPPQLKVLQKDLARLPYAQFVAKEVRTLDFNKKPSLEFPLPEKLGKCQVRADKNGRVQFRLFYKTEKKGRGSYAPTKSAMIFHNKKYRTAKGEQYIFVIMKKPADKKK